MPKLTYELAAEKKSCKAGEIEITKMVDRIRCAEKCFGVSDFFNYEACGTDKCTCRCSVQDICGDCEHRDDPHDLYRIIEGKDYLFNPISRKNNSTPAFKNPLNYSIIFSAL